MKKAFFVIALLTLATSAYADNGRKTVTSAGTAEALSTTNESYTTITMCAETDNTGVIVVGNSGVIASLSTRTGIPLDASDCYTIAKGNSSGSFLRDIYIDSTVSGDGVTFQYI